MTSCKTAPIVLRSYNTIDFSEELKKFENVLNTLNDEQKKAIVEVIKSYTFQIQTLTIRIDELNNILILADGDRIKVIDLREQVSD